MGLEMRWPEDKQKSSCRRKTGRLGSSAVQIPAPGLRLDSGTAALLSPAFKEEVEGRDEHVKDTTSGPGGAGSTKMKNPNSKTRKPNGSSKKTWDTGQRSNRKAKRSRGCE